MLLSPPDARLFFKLQPLLMCYVNQRLKVVAGIERPADFARHPLQARVDIRDVFFLKHPHLIRSFVQENPAALAKDELDIVDSWQHFVSGDFYIFRELKKYTVFLSAGEKPMAYGVLGLNDPLDEMVGPYLPVLVKTVLLPFKGQIIYDGLISGYNISFGSGFRRGLKESFDEAKQRYGIVTSLPKPEHPIPQKPLKPKPAPPSKEEKGEALQTVIGLIDQICKDQLNDEYSTVCRNMAEQLARKRSSPLLHGSPNAWASGIVRAVGGVNFLHDKGQTPYMRATDIDEYFGISPSAGAAKVAEIRKLLKIHAFDPAWTLPSRIDDNPMVWMVEVNGFVMDMRQAPRDLQEMAFKKGLIPYIPADRELSA
jgi:hypothetical protein